LGQVVGQDAFDHIAVLELEAHPESFGSGTRGKGLAQHEVGVGKFADEVHGLDVAQIDGDDVAGGVEQFEFAVGYEIGGRDVAADGVAVVFPHDDFFVSRGHGAKGAFQLAIPPIRKKRE